MALHGLPSFDGEHVAHTPLEVRICSICEKASRLSIAGLLRAGQRGMGSKTKKGQYWGEQFGENLGEYFDEKKYKYFGHNLGWANFWTLMN